MADGIAMRCRLFACCACRRLSTAEAAETAALLRGLFEESRVVDLQQRVCFAQRLSIHRHPLDRLAPPCYPRKARRVEHVKAVLEKRRIHHEDPMARFVSQRVVLELAIRQPTAGVQLAAASAHLDFQQI